MPLKCGKRWRFSSRSSRPTKRKNQNSGHYFFPDYPVSFNDGVVSAQGVFFIPDSPTPVNLEKAWQQTWHWDGAKEATADCRYVVLANDLLSYTLPYKKRVEMFQKFLCALVKALKPKAIYFHSSEKVVDASSYLNQVQADGPTSLYGLLNVRFFNVVQDNSSFMDTLGLHAVGLPDLQVRFKTYNPSTLAGLMHTYAHYIFDKGSVIKHGNTIQGVDAGQRWECRYAQASLEPPRNILDIQA